MWNGYRVQSSIGYKRLPSLESYCFNVLERSSQPGRYASTSCSVNRWGGDPEPKNWTQKSPLFPAHFWPRKFIIFASFVPLRLGEAGSNQGAGGWLRACKVSAHDLCLNRLHLNSQPLVILSSSSQLTIILKSFTQSLIWKRCSHSVTVVGGANFNRNDTKLRN